MVRIVKDSITRIHAYDENGNETIFTDTIEQYHYDSEEEKNEHRKLMEAKGFNDSGQVKENISSMSDPAYVWFGSYYKRSDRRAIAMNMLIQASNRGNV